MLASPPTSLLPAGAERWATINEVAIRTGKELKSVRLWAERQVVYSTTLAGGIGGIWVATTADGWPVNNPEGVKAYKAKRSTSAKIGAAVGARKGAARSVAVRAEKKRRAAHQQRRNA